MLSFNKGGTEIRYRKYRFMNNIWYRGINEQVYFPHNFYDIRPYSKLVMTKMNKKVVVRKLVHGMLNLTARSLNG